MRLGKWMGKFIKGVVYIAWKLALFKHRHRLIISLPVTLLVKVKDELI